MTLTDTGDIVDVTTPSSLDTSTTKAGFLYVKTNAVYSSNTHKNLFSL